MTTPSSAPCHEPRRLRAAACALLLSAWAALAAAERSPRDVVQSTSDQVLAALAQKDLSKDARRERVKTIVMQSTYFDTLSRLVLARNWSRSTPAQQAEFKREFESHRSATYNLVANFRSQFQEIVGSGGPEKLLQVMRDKTAKGEEFKN